MDSKKLKDYFNVKYYYIYIYTFLYKKDRDIKIYSKYTNNCKL